MKLKNFPHNFWIWLLRQSRQYPKTTGLMVFCGLAGFSLAMGIWLSTPGLPSNWTTWFNNAGVFLGWISLSAGWVAALLAWAHRREAALSFKNAGGLALTANQDFDASLILASRDCQSEWHIRHRKPRRVELLWTPMVQESTEAVLRKFSDIISKYSPPKKESFLSNEEVYEIGVIKQRCSRLLEDLLMDHEKSRICVDVTSGTAVMSLAAFQAAEELGITTIYLVGTHMEGKRLIINSKQIESDQAAQVKYLSDHRRH